jgi:hypothetical protein
MGIDFRITSYANSSFDSLATSSSGRRADDIARELIARSISKSSNISLVYKELLRSVIHAFSGFAILDAEESIIDVICIHAGQERAIAKLTEETNLILPIISVDQPKTNRAEKRQRYHPMVVTEKHWDPVKKRAIRLVSLVPSPIDIEYEVTVWAKYKNDLDQITEQIHNAFNPDIELVTPFATNIKMFLKEEASDSNVIVADREDRLLRRTFKIFASTYVPSPKFMMTSTGQIEDFNYEIEISSAVQKKTFDSFLISSEDIMPDPNALYNASALLGSAINISPIAGAALVYYGNSWAASETFLKAADIAELTAKVDSIEWGARYYRPDFVKLAYVSQYGTGETGNEVEGQGNSDLWTGTSAYGEIARWFVPELSFRGQGLMEIDITGYFDASVTPTTQNYTLFTASSYTSGLIFSGLNIPQSYSFFNTLDTADILDKNSTSGSRIRRIINGNGAITAFNFPAGFTSATPYIRPGLIRPTAGTDVGAYLVVSNKDRTSSKLNEASYFTVSDYFAYVSSLDYYTYLSTGSLASGIFNFTSSITCIHQTPSAAAMQTSSATFNLSSGDTIIFYKNTASLSSSNPASAAEVTAKFTLATNVPDSATLSALLNAEPTFVDATSLNLSAYDSGGKLKIEYRGVTDGFEFGVIGTGALKLGIQPVANTYYSYAYNSSPGLFDLFTEDATATANLASAVAVFEIQMADDPYDDTLDYTDLPYGVDVSTLGYSVYDPSGNAYAGNVNTSTLYSITYQPPASAVGLVGSATRGFPQPWTTIATFETGVSSFANVYSISRNDFNINIKFRSGGFYGATQYQPYVIEITQASGTEAVSKKVINRATMDFSKDKMMRVRFKCIQFSDSGEVVYYTDVPGPYVKKVVYGGELAGTYYWGLIPRVCTVTTLAATLSCPGDGHPF